MSATRDDLARVVGFARLITAVVLIGFVWLTLLPRLSEYPAIRDRIDQHRSAGIDPSAIYYTDHPRHFGRDGNGDLLEE
ncbi:hypothetical protein [Stratiformator vulcanicus]|uniref:Uncharacterized protein n=1 Tax=Stratiformator vulcanicus TaxID=2527980 RepID=A0A517QZ04_9PLAN|nr:hypothetical protein [Stratiformator vulcanicus]QDT36823.1 hypothetical protein Pan189_11860 [Stratiformator vulcanicus]